jgi:uncharacterized protein (DUF1501 family)
MTCCEGPRMTRRSALLGIAAAVSLGRVSLALAAAPTDRRFVVVILRGALDGLSLLQPYGDPALADLRGPLLLPGPGTPGGVLDCGGFFGLHPALSGVHAMYAAGECLPLHAIAGHYRSRSHFEAQDYLESGADQRLSSGWLNRAVSLLPSPPGHDLALSIGLSAPLLLRGPARVGAYAPDHFAHPDPDLYSRLIALSAHDPIIGPALAEGVRARGFEAQTLADAPNATTGGNPAGDFRALATAAGRLLAEPQGPRIAVLELSGWDTHSGQLKRLEAQLHQLDQGLTALKTSLGPAWKQTAILAVTEFGRTAHMNGTNGTDHGTGAAALLLGGAVNGGRIRADWPGLGAGRLLENRDLAPTADLRSLCKGLLVEQLGLTPSQLGPVFPGSDDAAPMSGLIRA